MVPLVTLSDVTDIMARINDGRESTPRPTLEPRPTKEPSALDRRATRQPDPMPEVTPIPEAKPTSKLSPLDKKPTKEPEPIPKQTSTPKANLTSEPKLTPLASRSPTIADLTPELTAESTLTSEPKQALKTKHPQPAHEISEPTVRLPGTTKNICTRRVS